MPNLKKIREELQPVGRSQEFYKNCRYHGNDDSAHTKNNRCLRLPIIHLHAKLEDDPRKTPTCSSLTRKSLRRTRRRDDDKTIVSTELCSGDTIIGWIDDCVNLINKYMCKWLSVGMNEWTNKQMNKFMHAYMYIVHKWMSEWILNSEWMNEWMSKFK